MKRCQNVLTGEQFAAKMIRKRRRGSGPTAESLHEAAVLELCRSCPHIVQLVQLYDTPGETILILQLQVTIDIFRCIFDVKNDTDQTENVSENKNLEQSSLPLCFQGYRWRAAKCARSRGNTRRKRCCSSFTSSSGGLIVSP